jgi:hypothetical protein
VTTRVRLCGHVVDFAGAARAGDHHLDHLDRQLLTGCRITVP